MTSIFFYVSFVSWVKSITSPIVYWGIYSAKVCKIADRKCRRQNLDSVNLVFRWITFPIRVNKSADPYVHIHNSADIQFQDIVLNFGFAVCSSANKEKEKRSLTFPFKNAGQSLFLLRFSNEKSTTPSHITGQELKNRNIFSIKVQPIIYRIVKDFIGKKRKQTLRHNRKLLLEK